MPSFAIHLARPQVRLEAPSGAARADIESRLSAPVPALAHFPAATFQASKLNFANLESVVASLVALLGTAAPGVPACARTRSALQKMPARLVLAVEQWRVRHASAKRHEGMREIPVDQFNLLVADGFRHAAATSRRTARDPRRNADERAFAADLAALLTTLKRLHYSANVQQLYEAAGRRALPEIERYGPDVRPGFSAVQSGSASVDFGAGIGGGSPLDLTVTAPLGFSTRRRCTIVDDGDYVVNRTRRFTTGVQASADFNVAGLLGMATARAAIDVDVEVGERFKSTEPAQIYRFYGERHKYEHRLIKSAAPARRAWTKALARACNTIGGLLLDEPRLLDPYRPVHATARKHMRGMYAEALLHRQAAAIDEHLRRRQPSGHREPAAHAAASASAPATAPAPATSPATAAAPGPVESLLKAAYPSTRHRIEAMRDPAGWTAEAVGRELPGQNAVKYQAVSRNAKGANAPVRAPLRSVRVEPEASGAIGVSINAPLTWLSPGLASFGASTPSIDLAVNPGTILNRSANKLARLTPLVDLMNVGQALDFAVLLGRLEDVRLAYGRCLERCSPGAASAGRTHPHLWLLDRFDAMQQLAGAPGARGEAGSDLSSLAEDGRHDGVYGEATRMPPAYARCIAAIRRGALSPLQLLRRVDANLSAYAAQDAAFKADATDAWALRHDRQGEALLRRMNADYFGGCVPLPAPGKLKNEHFREFFSRAYDAHAMALSNLGVQRSVALHEGRRQLGSSQPDAAGAARQVEFQNAADSGLPVYLARVAAHNEHNLPLPKDRAWRSSSIYSAGGNERSDFESAQELSGDPALQQWLSDWLPEPDLAIGTASARVAFTSTHQKSALNPLIIGRFPNLSIRYDAGFPGARGRGPLQLPFASAGMLAEAQWRLPPDESANPRAEHDADQRAAKAPPVERALQYWRVSRTRAINPGLKTPNLLAAAPGVAIKFGIEAESSVTTPVWQENGWCPAYNVLEWNRYLRALMWDATADRPLPFDRIAANFKTAPYELGKHFSRFNPTLRVPELFRQAVTRPDGPRNEFHRMLYDAIGARERAYSRLTALAAPSASVRLFEVAEPPPVFAELSRRAQTWPVCDEATLTRLNTASVDQRARYFLESPAGQEQLLRYMEVMEEANKYNNLGRFAGRGYNMAINTSLIASRLVQEPGHWSRLAKGLRVLRLGAEHAELPIKANTHSHFGRSSVWTSHARRLVVDASADAKNR